MARSIAEIKGVMTGEFMASEEMQIKYGFKAGDKWQDKFSKVSVENILFYVFAAGLYIVEKLFDTHKAEVDAALDTRLPHTARWYREKALGFILDGTLMEETDTYNTSGIPQSKIDSQKIVKYAAVEEDANASLLRIKVAGEENDIRSPLESEDVGKLAEYLNHVKDAGVKISIINKNADVVNITANVVYDPLANRENTKKACESAIKQYIENLPFNGEFSIMKLVDTMQTIEGVEDVHIISVKAIIDGNETEIKARAVPEAGYYKLGTYIETEEV